MNHWTDAQHKAFNQIGNAVAEAERNGIDPKTITMHPKTAMDFFRDLPPGILNPTIEGGIYVNKILIVRDDKLPIGEIKVE